MFVFVLNSFETKLSQIFADLNATYKTIQGHLQSENFKVAALVYQTSQCSASPVIHITQLPCLFPFFFVVIATSDVMFPGVGGLGCVP